MKFETPSFTQLLRFSLPLIFCASTSAYAQWEIQPYVQANVGYSDNIELEDNSDSGFVGEVNPGITISKPTGRLQVELDYLMQNFYYVDDGDVSTDHNLDSIARYALIPGTFFINGFARSEQVLIDNDRQISVDNFNDSGNTTDEYSYGIGPQFIYDIGSYARANLAYLYSEDRFGDDTADDPELGDLDDNDRQNFTASLGNINQRAERFKWLTSYDWEEVDFDFGEKFKFVTSQLDLGYQIMPRIELVGSYGYEDNDLGGNDILFDDEDGVVWTAGTVVGLGEFTALEVRRGERFFGNFWLGGLTIDGPKLSANISYEEVADLAGYDEIEFGFGNAADALDLLDNDVDLSSDDRNSVSVTKSWNAGVSYEISKSTLLLGISNDDEEFLDTGDTEQIETYSLGWIWRASAISSFSAIAEYEKNESDDEDGSSSSDFFDFDIEYIKKISPKTDFSVNYTYSEGDSDEIDDDFTSNTITAGIEHRF